MELEGRRPVAPRLLLVDRVGWFVLDQPALIPAGSRFWTERDALVVESPSGGRQRHPGRVVR